jgi:hypothetical protein
MKKVLIGSLVVVAMFFAIASLQPAKAATFAVTFQNRSDAYVDLDIQYDVLFQSHELSTVVHRKESRCFRPNSGTEKITLEGKFKSVSAYFYEKSCGGLIASYRSHYYHSAPLFWAHGTRGSYAFYHN